MHFIINGCSLDLEQLTERDLTALIDNQTKRAGLIASELRLLKAERRRRKDILAPQHQDGGRIVPPRVPRPVSLIPARASIA